MSSFFFEAFIIEVFLHISTLGFHVARLQLYCCHDATLRSTCLWCWGVAESVREGWRLEDWCIFFLQEDGRRNRVEKVRTDDHNQWSIFMSHWSIPLLFVYILFYFNKLMHQEFIRPCACCICNAMVKSWSLRSCSRINDDCPVPRTFDQWYLCIYLYICISPHCVWLGSLRCRQGWHVVMLMSLKMESWNPFMN